MVVDMALTMTPPQEAAWAELELMGLNIAKPPRRRVKGRWARADAGEWDWFYALPDDERRHILRRHMTEHGLAPDQFAHANGFDYVDECMTRWCALIRLTRRKSAQDWRRDWEGGSFYPEGLEPEPDQLMGPVEVAAFCGVKVDTCYQWVNRGRLPAPWAIISGTRLWPRHVIESWAMDTGRLHLEVLEQF